MRCPFFRYIFFLFQSKCQSKPEVTAAIVNKDTDNTADQLKPFPVNPADDKDLQKLDEYLQSRSYVEVGKGWAYSLRVIIDLLPDFYKPLAVWIDMSSVLDFGTAFLYTELYITFLCRKNWLWKGLCYSWNMSLNYLPE